MKDECNKDEGGRMKDENPEKPPDLRNRLSEFSLRVIRMYATLNKNDAVSQVLGKQVLRSGTSAGAHYREAARARSNAEFISKLEGGLQELDETDYWLDLIVHSGIVGKEKTNDLIVETNELIAILTSIVKKTKGGPK